MVQLRPTQGEHAVSKKLMIKNGFESHKKTHKFVTLLFIQGKYKKKVQHQT